jgi:hypothetical protein
MFGRMGFRIKIRERHRINDDRPRKPSIIPQREKPEDSTGKVQTERHGNQNEEREYNLNPISARFIISFDVFSGFTRILAVWNLTPSRGRANEPRFASETRLSGFRLFWKSDSLEACERVIS